MRYSKTKNEKRETSDDWSHLCNPRRSFLSFDVTSINMNRITPYLYFNGTCQKAIEFYCEVFEGEILFSQKYSDGPLDVPDADADKVMHATIQVAGGRIMASDYSSAADFSKKSEESNVRLNIGWESVATMTSAYEKLSAGGKITMPLEKQFWGDHFGMFTDKFGIQWMFTGRDKE